MSTLGQSHTLSVELRFDGAAPTGHVCVPGGEPQAFSGWMGLVGAVEELVSDPIPVSLPAVEPLR